MRFRYELQTFHHLLTELGTGPLQYCSAVLTQSCWLGCLVNDGRLYVTSYIGPRDDVQIWHHWWIGPLNQLKTILWVTIHKHISGPPLVIIIQWYKMAEWSVVQHCMSKSTPHTHGFIIVVLKALIVLIGITWTNRLIKHCEYWLIVSQQHYFDLHWDRHHYYYYLFFVSIMNPSSRYAD